MAQLPWLNTAALTVAASPLVSPWLQVTGETSQFVPVFAFVGGTSVNTIEGSFDGVNLDSSVTYGALTSGTAMTIQHPFIRWRTVQTVATATTANVYLRPRM